MVGLVMAVNRLYCITDFRSIWLPSHSFLLSESSAQKKVYRCESFAQKYEIRDLLGRGTNEYAHIFRGMDWKLTKTVAVKQIQFQDKKDGFPYDIMREISLLRELSDHPNIVRLFNVEKLSCGGCRLIFELGRCDLLTYLRENPQAKIEQRNMKKILVGIVRGLYYCHFQKVMHRDLEPCNILLFADGKVRLADFGLSRTFDVPLPKYSVSGGSLPYRAPEILLGLPYTNSIDIWALGCILAELVTKKPLFEGTSEAAVMGHIVSIFGMPNETDLPGAAAICRDKFDINESTAESRKSLASLVPGLPQDGFNLLQKMLCVNPSERITTANALLHPFLKEGNHTVHNLLKLEANLLHEYEEF